MRRPGPNWTLFAAGLIGGVLATGLLAGRESEPFSGLVNPVAGVESPKSAGSADAAPLAQIPVKVPQRGMAAAEHKPGAMDALPRLTPQEVSRRALAWSASIRGDGVYGAGIVIDPRGYILTNHHVVQGVEHIRVSFVDTEEMPAKVVDVDKDLDLALLKVDLVRESAAPPAIFLDTQVGDDVFAVGCPRKMNFTVSRGMVSFIGRKIDGRYYLQSDLPTNDGNSGGPVVNDRGEVVGVMTFILRDSQGLAFAVPIDYAYERFSDILQNARVDVPRFKRWRTERDAATASR